MGLIWRSGGCLSLEDLVSNSKRRTGDPAQLFTAAWKGDTQAAQALLDTGVNPNSKDAFWDTPLHAAASRPSEGMVKLLLSRGALANLRNRLKATPLHRAAAEGMVAPTRLLLESGADVHAADSNGSTPLHLAATRGRTPVIGLLLRAGAKTSTLDATGATPLVCAIKEGHADIAEVIFAASCPITPANEPFRKLAVRAALEARRVDEPTRYRMLAALAPPAQRSSYLSNAASVEIAATSSAAAAGPEVEAGVLQGEEPQASPISASETGKRVVIGGVSGASSANSAMAPFDGSDDDRPRSFSAPMAFTSGETAQTQRETTSLAEPLPAAAAAAAGATPAPAAAAASGLQRRVTFERQHRRRAAPPPPQPDRRTGTPLGVKLRGGRVAMSPPPQRHIVGAVLEITDSAVLVSLNQNSSAFSSSTQNSGRVCGGGQ